MLLAQWILVRRENKRGYRQDGGKRCSRTSGYAALIKHTTLYIKADLVHDNMSLDDVSLLTLMLMLDFIPIIK